MSNKGFEIVLNTQNFRKENFTWNTSFNIARNDNKITALPDNNADQIIGNTILRVGERSALLSDGIRRCRSGKWRRFVLQKYFKA